MVQLGFYWGLGFAYLYLLREFRRRTRLATPTRVAIHPKYYHHSHPHGIYSQIIILDNKIPFWYAVGVENYGLEELPILGGSIGSRREMVSTTGD